MVGRERKRRDGWRKESVGRVWEVHGETAGSSIGAGGEGSTRGSSGLDSGSEGRGVGEGSAGPKDEVAVGSEDGVVDKGEGNDELLGAHPAELVGGELACGDIDKRAVPTSQKDRTYRLIRGGNHPRIET